MEATIFVIVLIILIVMSVTTNQHLGRLEELTEKNAKDTQRMRDILMQFRLDFTGRFKKTGEAGADSPRTEPEKAEESPADRIRKRIQTDTEKTPPPVPPVPPVFVKTSEQRIFAEPPAPVMEKKPGAEIFGKTEVPAFSEKQESLFLTEKAAKAEKMEKETPKPEIPAARPKSADDFHFTNTGYERSAGMGGKEKIELAESRETQGAAKRAASNLGERWWELDEKGETRDPQKRGTLNIPPQDTDKPRIFTPNLTPAEPSAWDTLSAKIFEKGWNWFLYGKDRVEEGESFEFVVAANWLVRIAILILVLGIGFFLKYSIDQGWISPQMRVLATAGAGLGMYLYGLYLFPGIYRLLGQGLAAGGAVVLYFSVFATTEIYHLMAPEYGFLGACVVTAMLVFSALKRDSILIAVIGIAGAYFTPILFNTIPGTPVPSLMYLTIITTTILLVRIRHEWVLPLWISLIGTYALLHMIILSFDLGIMGRIGADTLTGFTQDRERNQFGIYAFHRVQGFFFGGKAELPLAWSGITMFFSCGLFLVLHAAALVRSLVAKREGHQWEFVVVLLNSLTFCATMYILIMKFAELQYASWVPGMLGVFFLLHAVYFWRRENGHTWRVIFTGMTVLFFGILVPTLCNEARMWILPCWALEAAALLWIAKELGSKNMVRAALIAISIVLAGTFIYELPQAYVLPYAANPTHTYLDKVTSLGLMPERFGRFGMTIFAAAFMAVHCGRMRQRPEMKEVSSALGVAAGVLLFAFANGETILTCNVYYPGAKFGAISVLWMLFSLGCIAAGILRDVPGLRHVGLWLFGTTVAKVFIWDMRGLEEIYRIISFIILGILILFAAALYLRGKQRSALSAKEKPGENEEVS